MKDLGYLVKLGEKGALVCCASILEYKCTMHSLHSVSILNLKVDGRGSPPDGHTSLSTIQVLSTFKRPLNVN